MAWALASLVAAPPGPLSLAGRAAANGPPIVVRVEEDWALLVSQPLYNLSCPQVSTQMAPGPDSTQFYQFHLNSQDVPKFVQGGLQLQAWDSNNVLAVKTSNNTATMGTANELVTWTQYLARSQENDGSLKFGITAAMSQTWGDFSGQEFTVTGADSVLDNYSADYSVQNSGVTYGVNLVTSFVLLQTRIYYSDPLIPPTIDSTVRVVSASQ
jgi:hypothetical protein